MTRVRARRRTTCYLCGSPAIAGQSRCGPCNSQGNGKGKGHGRCASCQFCAGLPWRVQGLRCSGCGTVRGRETVQRADVWRDGWTWPAMGTLGGD